MADGNVTIRKGHMPKGSTSTASASATRAVSPPTAIRPTHVPWRNAPPSVPCSTACIPTIRTPALWATANYPV